VRLLSVVPEKINLGAFAERLGSDSTSIYIGFRVVRSFDIKVILVAIIRSPNPRLAESGDVS
jgi:hypothetical protein